MLFKRQLLPSLRDQRISREDGTAGAGATLYLQQPAQPLWQQVGLQAPPQQAPQAAFIDLNCEVWAMAATDRTTTSESNAIVRFMICLL